MSTKTEWKSIRDTLFKDSMEEPQFKVPVESRLPKSWFIILIILLSGVCFAALGSSLSQSLSFFK